MKRLKGIAAILIVSAMMTGIAACNSETEVESSVSSELTVMDISSETSAEASGTGVQGTNENGEYVIEGETFEERYGSQLGSYLNHQYYFDDIEIPMYETNYYMIHQFVEFNNMVLWISHTSSVTEWKLKALRSEMSVIWSDHMPRSPLLVHILLRISVRNTVSRYPTGLIRRQMSRSRL